MTFDETTGVLTVGDRLLVCNASRSVYHVMHLSVSSTKQIVKQREIITERCRNGLWHDSWNSVIPFVGGSKYAIMTDTHGPKFPGINGCSTWMNSDHPKLAHLIKIADLRNLHPFSQDVVAQFFRAVINEEGYWAGEQSYIEYLIDQNRNCLLQLAASGRLEQSAVRELVLTFDDFADWDKRD